MATAIQSTAPAILVAVCRRCSGAGARLAPQLSLYSVASGIALASDVSVYLALTAWLTLAPAVAGAIGYGLGLLIHFGLSSRFVFRSAASAKSRVRLFTEFAASGMIGLAVTTIIIFAATDMVGLPALPAKAVAVTASFLAVFVLRRQFVFRA